MNFKSDSRDYNVHYSFGNFDSTIIINKFIFLGFIIIIALSSLLLRSDSSSETYSCVTGAHIPKDLNVINLDMCTKHGTNCLESCGSTSYSKHSHVSHNVLRMNDITKLPTLDYLPNFKSPCFYARSNNKISRRSAKLRCLPYFMIGGFPKCGTTDLYERLKLHEYIQAPLKKEPHWWSNYTNRPSLAAYTNLIGIPQSANLQSSSPRQIPSHIKQHHKIIGDFSTRELLDERHPVSMDHHGNTNSTLVHIKRVLPCMKFIVMMRDPVERLYSDYLYFSSRTILDHPNEQVTKWNQRISPIDFHRKCVASIKWWHECLRLHNNTVNACLYGTNIQGVPKLNPSHGKCWSNSTLICKAFRNGLYYHYIRNWLHILPRHHFIFIRLEDYSHNQKQTINRILRFLNIDPNLDPHYERRMESIPRQIPGGGVQHSRFEDMMPQTRQMLRDFYRDANRQLARLLGDEGFNWY